MNRGNRARTYRLASGAVMMSRMMPMGLRMEPGRYSRARAQPQMVSLPAGERGYEGGAPAGRYVSKSPRHGKQGLERGGLGGRRRLACHLMHKRQKEFPNVEAVQPQVFRE